MEIIKRNSSLTEYNNCISDEELIYVYNEVGVGDDKWTCFNVEGGITIYINKARTKSLVAFAPRVKDGTVDIVLITLGNYVSNILIAVAQFLTMYHIKNPFGLKNKRKMHIDKFLDGLSSYMSMACNTDDEIEDSLKLHKEASKANQSLETIVGGFRFDHHNGKVKVSGGMEKCLF